MHSQDSRAWKRPDDSAATARNGSARLIDPEDDLPSAHYAGDFETTRIPNYDSAASVTGGYGLDLLAEPEPLPYVEPETRSARGLYEFDPDEDALDERVVAAGRRGTQHFGLFVLRVGVGAILIAHGLQKLFGWWGGPGLDGFKGSLATIGYRHADILTYVAAGGQLVAGVLLVLGLITPLAAAAALAYQVNGLLANVAAQHDAGYITFALPNGSEHHIVLIVATAAVILAGPGSWGLDAGRGWARRPFVGSFAALALGVGVGVGAWILLNGSNPLG